MFRRKNKSEQRGTLMVEAIAMLGLIAIVTPTLYKKSAERLQEIQDINIASQARTMAGVVETFVRNKASLFRDYVASSGVSIFEVCKNDDCRNDDGTADVAHLENYLNAGYSSAIPYGFKPQEVKFFGDPRVFVISEEGNIVFYIVYPRAADLGKRRAVRLASLVGAQGGIIENSSKIQGTGGAWELDSSMISEMNIPASLMLENSLVLTNSEPITTAFEDTDKFLYRIPASEQTDYFHNTMVTDLYLGGNVEDDSLYSSHSREFYSIFNVRKMTLNTRCTAEHINMTGGSAGTDCDPDVADLYIGKPTGLFASVPQTPGVTGPGSEKKYSANTGAAWIYGNLSALNERFKMWNTSYDSSGASYDRQGYDILQFSHEDTVDSSDTVIAGNAVFMASNEEQNGKVAMIDGMVRAVEKFTANEITGDADEVAAFLVGGENSSVTSTEGRLITAYEVPSGGRVNINDKDDLAVTRINTRGGDVYINGARDTSSTVQITAHTFVNSEGGELSAGKDGQWIYAGEIEDSAHVDIFSSGVGNRFTVGGTTSKDSFVWANREVTSLRDGAIRAYEFNNVLGNKGGVDVITDYESSLVADDKLGTDLTNAAAVLAAKYTDVLGPAYFGTKGAMEATIDSSLPFVRDDWKLGVAGSAWVDELLFANEAWFNSSGMKELHAGFERFTEFKNTPSKAWLNAYDDSVLIRNRAAADSSTTGMRALDARFYANSSDVYLGDSKGAMAHLNEGVALFGFAKDLPDTGIPALHNMVGADSTEAFVVGNELVEVYTSSRATEEGERRDSDVGVDIQKGAMLFQGHSWSNSSRDGHDYDVNTIDAHAAMFAVHTRPFRDSTGAVVNNAAGGVLYADSTDVLTRVVDFSVQDNKGDYVLKARPMIDNLNSSQANVEVDGSFHVTGNRVVHIASSQNNSADDSEENPHAMFEVDPRFVRVMALDNNDSTFVMTSDLEPLAMLEVNPYDVDGSSTVGDNPTDRASVYIRRGAIELEKSTTGGSASWAADEGYGYIKANRLVSNVAGATVPVIRADAGDGAYDQYMVNPAYTSVMHDIKLTTRGGARLSDILPDYVLKGVYNVSNDYLEASDTKRICWSSNYASGCENADAKWADPYVGIIPYAVCPPGYRNMATIVPISFQMGQAGDILKSSDLTQYGGSARGKYVVNPNKRQARILSNANGEDLVYPGFAEVKTFHYNKMVATGSSFNPADDFKERTAGWFLGADAHLRSSGVEAVSDMKWDSSNGGAWKYAENGSDYLTMAEPLYFQQNTFLKTTLEPSEKGWKGRMGFLYDADIYNLGRGLGNAGIYSNNNPKGYNDDASSAIPFDQPGDWVWNLFPVPTNTLEGHATVYCYFDRTKFKDGEWKDLVDPIDQMNNFRRPFGADGSAADAKPEDYRNRLNDPSLKYDDPW